MGCFVFHVFAFHLKIDSLRTPKNERPLADTELISTDTWIAYPRTVIGTANDSASMLCLTQGSHGQGASHRFVVEQLHGFIFFLQGEGVKQRQVMLRSRNSQIKCPTLGAEVDQLLMISRNGCGFSFFRWLQIAQSKPYSASFAKYNHAQIVNHVPAANDQHSFRSEASSLATS